MMAGTIRTGMAGWVFPEWRKGQFYPEEPGSRRTSSTGRAVTSPQSRINSTFYQNQKPASFEGWAAQTPPGFKFTVKGHQLVTHIKRLKDVDEPLRFFFRRSSALGRHLGAVLLEIAGELQSFDTGARRGVS